MDNLEKDKLDLYKLEKKYKTYRWVQCICFILSLACCVLPVIIATVMTAPSMFTMQKKIALSGTAIFFAVLVVLIVFRSLVHKFVSKLSYTVTVLLSVLAILLLMLFVKKIIDDAIALLVVALIGAIVAVIFELISLYCKVMAQETKEIYIRRRNKV